MTEPSPTQYVPPTEPDPSEALSPTSPVPAAPSTPNKTSTNGLAITALVLGICGLTVCPLLLSIPAIVFGAVAMRDINRDPGQEGKGMALAGFITGIVGTVLGLILIIIAIAIGIAAETDSNNREYHPGPGNGHEYNLN